MLIIFDFGDFQGDFRAIQNTQNVGQEQVSLETFPSFRFRIHQTLDFCALEFCVFDFCALDCTFILLVFWSQYNMKNVHPWLCCSGLFNRAQFFRNTLHRKSTVDTFFQFYDATKVKIKDYYIAGFLLQGKRVTRGSHFVVVCKELPPIYITYYMGKQMCILISVFKKPFYYCVKRTQILFITS